MKLVDAPRCPYCARVRIALAEKGLRHETVVVDLDDRPAWLYAFRRGEANELAARLETLEVGQSLFADVAYVPWVIRARDLLEVELPARLAAWLDLLAERPAVAAEVEVVRGL